MIQKGDSHTYLCPVLNIGLPVQEQTDHLCSALEAGQGEGCIAIGLDLSVNIRTHIKQQLHGRYMAIHSSQHQRRNTQFTPSPKEKETLQFLQLDERLGKCKRI